MSLVLLLSGGGMAATLVEAPREVGLPADGAALQVPLAAERARDIRLQLVRAPVGVQLERDGRVGWTLRWDRPETRFEATVVLDAAPYDAPTERERIEIRLLPAGTRPDRSADPQWRLAPISAQWLTVGKPWELWLRPSPVSGEPDGSAPPPLELDADAPDALTIQAGGDGWYRLAMVPTRPGVLRFGVVVQPEAVRTDVVRQPIVLHVRLAGDRSAEPVRDAPPPGPTSVEAPPLPPRLQTPAIEPVSNQIVSAGRAVVFRVSPLLPEGQRAIVQIDRLPRNARFDEGEGGTRTFHWLTGDSDQGEHRFRLTAINEEDPSLSHSTDVTVIVGDPTRGKTLPAQ